MKKLKKKSDTLFFKILEKMTFNFKSASLALILSCLFFFALGLTYSLCKPKIKVLIIKKISHAIENQNLKKNDFKISLEDFDLHLFSLKMTLSHLKLHFKKAKKNSQLEFIKVKKIKFSLKPLPIYRSLKSLIHLTLQDIQVSFHWNEISKKNVFPLSLLHQWMMKSPFSKIYGKNINFSIKTKKDQFQFNSPDIFFKIFPDSSKKAVLAINSSLLKVEKKETKKIPLWLKIKGKFIFSYQGIQTQFLKIKLNDSFLEKKGFLAFPIHFSHLNPNQFMYSLQSHMKAKDFSQLLKFFSHQNQPSHPNLEGEFDFKGTLFNKNKIFFPHLQLKAKNVKFSDYTIGNLLGSLTWEKNKNLLFIPSLKIKNHAASLELINAHFKLFKPFYFKSIVRLEDIELASFLKTLKIPKSNHKKLPVSLKSKGISLCHGRVIPQPLISCTGHANVKDLFVQTDQSKDKILHLKKAKITGSLEINNQSVFYKAHLSDKEYFFQSVGQIFYKKGFKIFYAGSAKDMKPLSLFHLNMRGSARFNGKVFGNRFKATVESKIKTKNFSLNHYPMGNLKFQLNYKNKRLHFKRIKGLLKKSIYKGNFLIHVQKKTIALSIKSPFLEFKDLNSLLNEKMKLPFRMKGKGLAKIKISGPLDWNQLQWNIESSGQNGTFYFKKYKEDFLNFYLNIQSKGRLFRIKNITLNKEVGYFELKGKIFPNLKIKGTLLGKNLHLEELNSLNSSSLSGELNFKSLIHGSFDHPQIHTELFLTQTRHKNQPLGNSQLTFSKFKNSYKGKGVFFGEKIKTHFSLPSSTKKPSHIFLQANNLELIQILEMFQKVKPNSGTKFNISGLLHLKSKKGGVLNSTGSLKIKNLKINQGLFSLTPSRKKPILIQFKNGKMKTHFSLQGTGGFLEFKSKKSRKDQLNMDLKSNLKLNFFNLFSHSLTNLGGELDLALKMEGSFFNPKIFGSLYLKEGQAQFKTLPLSFEKIQSDILFSNKKIILNYIDGKVNQGTFIASGQMNLKKNKLQSVNINSNFEDVFIEKEGLEALGSGQLSIKGNKKPFQLTGFYNIKKGKMNTDLSFQNQKSIEPEAFHASLTPSYRSKVSPFNLNFFIRIKDPMPVKIIIGPLDIHSSLSGALRFKDKNQKLVAEGDLNLVPGGSVILNSNNTFEISTGLISYNDHPINQPNVHFVTDARIDPINQEEKYDVQLLAQGPLNNIQINLKSNPHLEEKDIVALLVMGIAPFDDDSSFQENSIFKIDTNLLTHQLEFTRLLRKSLGLDFNLSSKIDRFDENESIEALTLRYQLNPNFVAEASQTLEKETKRNVKIEYKFNKNFSFTSHLEQKELNSLQDGRNVRDNIFGIDFQYKKEF